MYTIQKVDKITGIIVQEKTFPNIDAAAEFIDQLAKMGYKFGDTDYICENERFYINVK